MPKRKQPRSRRSKRIRIRIQIHPGDILREEFMKPLGLSANALATALRVPATRIGEIIHRARAVSADTAARLARYFDTTAEFWMNLQSQHDLSRLYAEKGKEIEADIRPHAA